MITIYTKKELEEAVPCWGQRTINELFQRPDFPAQKQGKTHFVEEGALKEYLKVHHEN